MPVFCSQEVFQARVKAERNTVWLRLTHGNVFRGFASQQPENVHVPSPAANSLIGLAVQFLQNVKRMFIVYLEFLWRNYHCCPFRHSTKVLVHRNAIIYVL